MPMTPERDYTLHEDWTLVAVLPNIDVLEPIETDIAALVHLSDPRVIGLSEANPNIEHFLNRFTDAFNQQILPTVLLCRAPLVFDREVGLSSFRDAIALSVVPFNQAKMLLHSRGDTILYSNHFWIYPMIVDERDLIMSSPALIGLHDVYAF
jgi:hypothetical protein